MKVLITGICGFVGSSLAREILSRVSGVAVLGVDSLVRPGSEMNRTALRELGIGLFHGDVRCSSDFEQLPAVDWVIDAAASPSVLIGADGRTTSRQAIEHNLLGSVNVLEYCKARRAGIVLLSSSRVYSIPHLQALPLKESADSFVFDEERPRPPGVSSAGVSESFSTGAPISLYGATKLASEALALEYGYAYDLPVWINRCGVLAGAGQFGTAEQGIFSFWIHAHAQKRPLRFCGFGGRGLQVRDALHPRDLATMVIRQICGPRPAGNTRIFNVGGGLCGSVSLAQLATWSNCRFGEHPVGCDDSPRIYDVPWIVMDSSEAQSIFGWTPQTALGQILEEVACHAEAHPEWLRIAGA